MNKTLRIKWIISLVIAIGIFFIPTTETFTFEIKKYIAITFLGVLMFAFELLPTLAISLFIPFAYLISNLAPMEKIFSGWTQTTVWMIFATILLGTILDQSKLMQRIAYFLFVKIGTSFSKMLFCILLLGIFMAYFAPGCGSLFVILGYSLCRSLDIKPFSNAAVLMFFVAYVSGNALSVMLSYDGMFDASLNIINSLINSTTSAAAALSAFDYNISFLDYAFHNIIFLPVAFVILWVALKLIKPEKEYTEKFNKTYFSKEYEKMGAISPSEKSAIVLVFILIILLCTQKFTGLSVTLCIFIPSILAFFPGFNLANEQTIKQLNFTVVFFVTGTLSIGTVGNAVGVGQLLSNFLANFINTNSFFSCGIAYIIGYIVNLILTPMAGVSMLAGPIATAIAEQGIYPIPVLYSLINGLNNVLLPHEGALYVFLFSLGYMKMSQFIKVFTIRSIIMLLWIVLFAVPYWLCIGLFDGFVTIF